MTDLDVAQPAFEIRCADSASSLTLEIVRVTHEGTLFHCALQKGPFRGAVEANTYLVGLPSSLFSGLAREWRGWSGTKEWGDIEEAVVLKATSDLTGHITLRVEMCSQPEGATLAASLTLEAGSLHGITQGVTDLFAGDKSLQFVQSPETEK